MEQVSISIVGASATGKSSIAAIVAEALKSQGIEVSIEDYEGEPAVDPQQALYNLSALSNRIKAKVHVQCAPPNSARPRVHYVDVGDLPPDRVLEIMAKIRTDVNAHPTSSIVPVVEGVAAGLAAVTPLL